MKLNRYIMIACPLKLLGCLAVKPRKIEACSMRKHKGRCRVCPVVQKSLKFVKRKFGNIPIRFTVVGGHRILQIKIACISQKCPNCRHKKPRWIFLNRHPKARTGICQPCSMFRGGFIDKRFGYRLIKIGPKWIGEHRFIMEKHLGRKLRKGETVHHLNCKRADNRIENLELRMAGDHPKGWSLRQMREYLKTIPKHLGGLK